MTPEGMKELQDALSVTNRIQNRHALMIEDHQRWLESHQRWMEEHQRWAQERQKWEERMEVLMDQIAAAQLANAEGFRELREGLGDLKATVQAFIDSLRRGGNGRG
jgi:hypothetical protein